VTDRYDHVRTDRLLMRRWRDSDRGLFAAMNADVEVMRYFPGLMTATDSDAFVDRIEARFETQGFGLWALELVETGEFLGYTGLNPMPDGVPGAGGMEIGWRLKRSAWGQGYATEAAHAAVDVAFNGVGLGELWSMTAVLNEPSQAVMRRIGMTLYGRFEHPAIDVDSPIRPHVAYRLERPA
jgi:RimJ/RimL family protein N-acetyltransferase